MTKFQVMSDLHSEFYKVPEVAINKNDLVGDVLLLAGDIGSVDSTKFLKDLEKPTFYVLGNHEFYNQNIFTGISEYKNLFAFSQVYILEKDISFHENVRIVGATMWTDFWVPMPEGHKEKQAAYCFRTMNDFYVIEGMNVLTWEHLHEQAKEFLENALKQPHDGPTIVMTHHAPSFKSSHPKWGFSAIKGGFCVELEHLIEAYKPDVWVHGHCHESFDYNIGTTRIICNPAGYYQSNSEFNPKLIFEL